MLLQFGENTEDVGGGWIAFRPQHAHEARGGELHRLLQFGGADRGVDIVVQNGLTGGNVADEHALDGFAQQSRAESRIGLRLVADEFLEISCQCHVSSPLLAAFVLLPESLCLFDVALLTLLRASAQQDDQTVSILAQIDAVAGAEVNAVFENASANALN